ncbi:unnamed protein product, partial [Didymodactylos carnosus]
ELSIPSLNSILKRDEEKLNLFRTLKTKQIKIEEQAVQRAYQMAQTQSSTCKPPECQNHFESIRLLLCHYGFCSLDSMEHLLNGKHWPDSKAIDRLQPRIQLLNSNDPSFITDLKQLDMISPTLYCTAQIFYLKFGQKTIFDSFSNTSIPEKLNSSFLTVVSKLGSVVDVKRHCGWTGNPTTSWKPVNQTAISTNVVRSKTLNDLNGDDSILYWVDLTTEMAFYLPQQLTLESNDVGKSSEMRIFIVWLEELREDLDSILNLNNEQPKLRDISIIGIHPLKNHLFRIILNSNAQRANASIPLIDGMVIPLNLLEFFIRQSVLNLSKRKRLEDSESSQTAHSLRKNKITKIIQKYHTNHSDIDEFFRGIFFVK